MEVYSESNICQQRFMHWFYHCFSIDVGARNGPNSLPGINFFGTNIATVSKDRSGDAFWLDFGSLLVPLGSLRSFFGSLWFHLAPPWFPFGILLAPFRPPFGYLWLHFSPFLGHWLHVSIVFKYIRAHHTPPSNAEPACKPMWALRLPLHQPVVVGTTFLWTSFWDSFLIDFTAWARSIFLFYSEHDYTRSAAPAVRPLQ